VIRWDRVYVEQTATDIAHVAQSGDSVDSKCKKHIRKSSHNSQLNQCENNNEIEKVCDA